MDKNETRKKKMNIALIGATGKTGSHVLGTALARGHSVTALVRGAGRITPAEQLHVIEGSGTDAEALAKLVGDADAVIVTVNHMVNRPGLSTHRDVAAAVCKAIRDTCPSAHLVMQTSASHGLPGFEHSAGRVMTAMMGFMLDHVIADHRAAEQLLQSAGEVQRYTVFCPPRIVDAPAVGDLVLGVNELPQGTFTVTYQDMANVLVDEVENAGHMRQRVGVNGTREVKDVVKRSSAEPRRLLWQNIRMKVLRLGPPD